MSSLIAIITVLLGRISYRTPVFVSRSKMFHDYSVFHLESSIPLPPSSSAFTVSESNYAGRGSEDEHDDDWDPGALRCCFRSCKFLELLLIALITDQVFPLLRILRRPLSLPTCRTIIQGEMITLPSTCSRSR